MRAYYFSSLLVAALFSVQQPMLAQQPINSQASSISGLKVDSAFAVNLSSIKQKIISKQRVSSKEDDFMKVASLMSGTTFYTTECFGPRTYTFQQIAQCDKWYRLNRNKISWAKLTKGLHLLTLPDTDAKWAKLEAIKIR